MMSDMRLIMNICSDYYKWNTAPSWKFITKKKLNVKFHNTIDEFMNSDIFTLADEIMTFLSVISNTESKYTWYMPFTVYDDRDDVIALYDIDKGCISVIDNGATMYTVYRKADRVNEHYRKEWEIVCANLKSSFLKIVLNNLDRILPPSEVKNGKR